MQTGQLLPTSSRIYVRHYYTIAKCFENDKVGDIYIWKGLVVLSIEWTGYHKTHHVEWRDKFDSHF